MVTIHVPASQSQATTMTRQPSPGTQDQGPFIQIVEQPCARGLRFHYEYGGRSACTILGESSTLERKTFPSIKICNYSGPAVIVVSCVTKEEPYKPHPNNLVGKDCKKGVCAFRIRDTTTASFPHLRIQCAKKKDVEGNLKMRQDINVDPFQTGFKHKTQNIDLNVVRLCFQVFLPDEQGKITRIVPPVVSQAIHDQKKVINGHQPTIDLHMRRNSGSVAVMKRQKHSYLDRQVINGHQSTLDLHMPRSLGSVAVMKRRKHCYVDRQIQATRAMEIFSRLSDVNTFINFNESAVSQPVVLYRIKEEIIFSEDLDVAVLEISNPSCLPMKMTLRKPKSFETGVTNVSLIGYGHTNHSKKCLDPKCEILSPISERVQLASRWLQQNLGKYRSDMQQILQDPNLVVRGYHGYDHPTKIIFNCFMEHGGSGSPAVTNDNERSVDVVAMLTHGLPEFYFKLSPEIQAVFPKQYRFELGTSMTSIYEWIRTTQPESLLKDLFN